MFAKLCFLLRNSATAGFSRQTLSERFAVGGANILVMKMNFSNWNKNSIEVVLC